MGARKLIDASAAAGYAPFGTIDGRILPHQLVDTFDRREQAPVPLIAGFTSGEVRSLRFLLPPTPASPAMVNVRYMVDDVQAADWLTAQRHVAQGGRPRVFGHGRQASIKRWSVPPETALSASGDGAHIGEQQQ